MTFSPPSISPAQMNLLRIVASLAWCDGDLAPEEAELMLDSFSTLFSSDENQRHTLRQELKEYVTQNLPLEELVPKLTTDEDRSLVLKLGYMVILASRYPGEERINPDEKAAYRRLAELLHLPEDKTSEIEAVASQEMEQSDHDLIRTLTEGLKNFFQR